MGQKAILRAHRQVRKRQFFEYITVKIKINKAGEGQRFIVEK